MQSTFGGVTTVPKPTLRPRRCFSCVTVAAAMALATTSLSKTYKPWPMTLASRFASLTIRPTPPSTIRSRSVPQAYEHRLLPHVSRACQGAIFDSIETVQALIAKTSTKTGLTVATSIIDAVYETGRKATDNFIENMTILFDEHLPNTLLGRKLLNLLNGHF